MTSRALILSAEQRGEEFRRWSLAAAIVLALHLALAASYLLTPPLRPSGAPSAPAVIIELAPLAVSPPSEADLAPGPPMLESQAEPEVVPQPEPLPLPQVEPIPKAEAPAEVVLPRPEPMPKPIEEKKREVKKPEVKKQEIQKQPAPRTTAAPRSERRTAPRAAAPSPGSAASSAAIASWRDQVVARLQSVKRYPSGADGSGTVMLSFTVNRSGSVIGKSVTRSSGNAAFDQEALAMVSRASPFPPVPDAIPGASVHLPVPINFSRR